MTNLANFFDVCKQKMIYPATKSNIEYAAKLLQCGELVAFPTETVYGLGADAKNPQAIAQVFTAKGRPQNHPLIVHLGDYSQLGDWVSNIPDAAKKLAQQFWPGPMTLILPRAVHVSTLITGGQDSIGIRIPHHPVALALLNEFGSGIVAPSANRFGHVSPTCAQHVQDELGDEIAILDGGACDIGVESTIIDLTSDQVRIVRPGIITASQIEHVIMQPVLFGANINLRVSGHLASHYAPLTPLKIVSSEELKKYIQQNKTEKIAVLNFSDNPQQYAHDLYAILRKLDQQNYSVILVEQVPESEEWLAVKDRLTKAAAKN